MKLIKDTLANLRLLQVILVVCVSVLLCFQITFPALAVSNLQSDPKDATTQLLETQRRTDELAKSAPINPQTVKGLNEVQGKADIDKMFRPGNPQLDTSVEKKVEGFLRKVTGKK